MQVTRSPDLFSSSSTAYKAEKPFDAGDDSILLTSLQFSFGYNQPAFVDAIRGGILMEIILPDSGLERELLLGNGSGQSQALNNMDLTQLDENYCR